MTSEWMPVNPCGECPDNPYGCQGVCPPLATYIDMKYAQRKLLEYLDNTKAIDMHVTIRSMLKQLEKGQ